jgi:hypothetical protein
LAKRLLARPLAVGHHETALTTVVLTPPRQSVESCALGRNSSKASADIGTSSLPVSARAPTNVGFPPLPTLIMSARWWEHLKYLKFRHPFLKIVFDQT